jgi:hypothetical protein
MDKTITSFVDAEESTKDQVVVSEENDNIETEGFEVGDVITDVVKRLEAEVKRSYSLGRRSRLAAWRTLGKIFDDRDVFHKDKPKYLKSFPQYLYDTYEISQSAAYSDAKVVAMLSSECVKVLESEHKDLIYMVRTIANAPEKFWKPLLSDIEKYDRETLSETIAKLRKGKTKKKESEIVEQKAKWEDVSTSFNPIKGSLKIEYTGESKEAAKEYLAAIQMILVSTDQEEVISLANNQIEEDSALIPIVVSEEAPSPSVPSGPAPVLTHDQKYPNRNPYEEEKKEESLI